VPTETVYGLAANGLDEAAVERIYEVKGRPEWKPINLLVTDIAAAEAFTEDIPEAARVLAEKFWPGPLTMIFKKKRVPCRMW
jgi:L-threonylcarbamoyladenylate synthase